MYKLQWSQSALDDIQALAAYIAEESGITEAKNRYLRLKNATKHLVEFPRLYEEAPEYGEGVRRISTAGQCILYELDDETQVVTLLAVVGQRQQSKKFVDSSGDLKRVSTL